MSQDDSKIEQLKKKLYSNSDHLSPPHRGRLHQHVPLVNSSWEAPPDESYPKIDVDQIKSHSTLEDHHSYKGLSKNALKKGALFSFLFVLVVIGIAVFLFLKGGNVISGENIIIKMLGPVTTPAGEELSLDIDVTNNNPTDMVLTDLIMTYPEGTRQAGDKSTAMVSARLPVGTIKSGQTIRKTVKSILFGEENVKKIIKVTLEYRVPDTDTIFIKEKEYPIFIGSSPITLTVKTLKEITANQEAVFNVDIESNSTSVVKGMVLKAEYPAGFQFVSSDLQPISGNNIWNLGDVAPSSKRTIVIHGKIIGGDSEERAFRFYAGTEDSRDESALGTVFVNSTVSIAIRKPFLGADIALDGHGDPIYVATAGDAVKGEITWQNNLDVSINDVVIEAKITGEVLDKTTVDGDKGYYRSIDDTLLWDKTTLEDLKEIGPGQVGRVQFSFASIQPTAQNNSTFRRPSMNIELSIHGKRLNEDRVSEEIKSNVSRQIKIASGLSFSSVLVRSVGPFVNTGPNPPRAEQESTYTVMVSTSNSFNTVKGATFTTTLPTYVKWVNKIYPDNSAFTYSPDKRELTVMLGDIAPGTGYTSTAKQFSFQVSYLPSISQIGTTPIIINQQRLAGKDIYSDVIVESGQDPLDIKIEGDPAYKYGEDKVTQ